MRDAIEHIRRSALSEIESADTLSDLELIRVQYLARKGSVAELFDQLKNIPVEERPANGKLLNELRSVIDSKFHERKALIEARSKPKEEIPDLTLPGREGWIGSKHIL